MPKPRATTGRRLPARRPRRSATRPAEVPAAPGPVALRSPPTGHAVCQACGRIVRLALAPTDGANLEAFLDRRPDGWSAHGITLTITGLCAHCRAGPSTPR